MHEKNVLCMHYIVFNNTSALESGNIASNTNSNARPTPAILFGLGDYTPLFQIRWDKTIPNPPKLQPLRTAAESSNATEKLVGF